MNNVLLGKTIKAMYKLSGKTLSQLSDETGLSVDTINNLFYARIQKPGLADVNALVTAMGFSIRQLMDFLDGNPNLAENCDITDLFTKYISAVTDTSMAVKTAKEPVKGTKGNLSTEIELLNAEYERVLDRFRTTHQRYVEQLQEQHNRHIGQLQSHHEQMKLHYEDTLTDLKSMHAREIERLDRENMRIRRTARILGAVVGIETALILLLLILDMVNRSIGWMR